MVLIASGAGPGRRLCHVRSSRPRPDNDTVVPRWQSDRNARARPQAQQHQHAPPGHRRDAAVGAVPRCPCRDANVPALCPATRENDPVPRLARRLLYPGANADETAERLDRQMGGAKDGGSDTGIANGPGSGAYGRQVAGRGLSNRDRGLLRGQAAMGPLYLAGSGDGHGGRPRAGTGAAIRHEPQPQPGRHRPQVPRTDRTHVPGSRNAGRNGRKRIRPRPPLYRHVWRISYRDRIRGGSRGRPDPSQVGLTVRRVRRGRGPTQRRFASSFARHCSATGCWRVIKLSLESRPAPRGRRGGVWDRPGPERRSGHSRCCSTW